MASKSVIDTGARKHKYSRELSGVPIAQAAHRVDSLLNRPGNSTGVRRVGHRHRFELDKIDTVAVHIHIAPLAVVWPSSNFQPHVGIPLCSTPSSKRPAAFLPSLNTSP